MLDVQHEHPQQSAIHLALGQCYQRQKDWQSAVDSYQRAIINSGNASANVYFRLGTTLQHLGQYQDAKTAYNQAIQRDPAHPHAKKMLVQICELIDGSIQ